jgi:hypothetical protein
MQAIERNHVYREDTMKNMEGLFLQFLNKGIFIYVYRTPYKLPIIMYNSKIKYFLVASEIYYINNFKLK